MTPEDLARLQALGLSGTEFAVRTEQSPSTVYGWGRRRGARGIQDTPHWVGLLIDAWERCPEALAIVRARPLRFRAKAAE